MGDTHRRFGLVDVLATSPGSAIDIDAQIGRINVNIDVFSLWQHRHGTGRSMDAALGFRFRNPLHPVCATLVLKTRIDSLAADHGDHFLHAAGIGLGTAHYFNPPALAFGITTVHAEQIAGKKGRFVTAGSSANLQNNVLFVVGILGQEQQFESLLHLAAPLF